MLCEFGFVELAVRRKIEQRVYEDRDRVVLCEIESSAGVFLTELFFLSAVSRTLQTAHA